MPSIVDPDSDHNPDDPEEFCSDCFAGMESSEHHEKCVRPQEVRDDLRAWLLVHLSGRHVKLYGGSQGLLHHESVGEIIEGLLRDAD
jgi:hypothetical protein